MGPGLGVSRGAVGEGLGFRGFWFRDLGFVGQWEKLEVRVERDYSQISGFRSSGWSVLGAVTKLWNPEPTAPES